MMHTTFAEQEAVFSFGGFELFPKRRLLSRDGRPVKIGSRAFDLLVVLVENAGNVIEKNQLISRVWGRVVVEETNLRVHISILRRLLGDDGFESRYIVHRARRGYVFVAPLDRCGGDREAYAPSGPEVRVVTPASSRSRARRLDDSPLPPAA